nr:hypothetical protein [Halocatena marina]
MVTYQIAFFEPGEDNTHAPACNTCHLRTASTGIHRDHHNSSNAAGSDSDNLDGELVRSQGEQGQNYTFNTYTLGTGETVY